MAAVVLAASALVASCGSPQQGDAGTSTGETGAAATSVAAESAAPSVSESGKAAALEAAGIPPKPDEATAAAYIAELEAIDPKIVDGKPERAIDRGRNQCSAVKNWPDDLTKQVEQAQKRFTAAGYSGGFGLEKSERIVAVVRKYLCPTY